MNKPKKAKRKESEESWSAEYEDHKRAAESNGEIVEEDVPFHPNSRPPRPSADEIFENIFGIQDSNTDDDAPVPVVSKFQRDKAKAVDFNQAFERGDHKYAPSRRNPYYMTIKRDDFGQLFGGQAKKIEWATGTAYKERLTAGTAIVSYFNVSLKLFHDMANDNVDWFALSRLIDPDVEINDDETEAVMLKEMAFNGLLDPPSKDPLHNHKNEAIKNQPVVILIDSMWEMSEEEDPNPPDVFTVDANLVDMDADWAKERQKITHEISINKGRRIYIPIRHQMGWPMWVYLGTWGNTEEKRLAKLGNIKKGFLGAWMTATATDPESAAGYRARFSSADLGITLYVVPNPINLSFRLGWPLDKVQSSFKKLVDEINNRKTQQTTELEIRGQNQVKGDAWIKMGENPFGLFDTYVSTDHFNAYMKTLEVVHGYANQGVVKRNAHRDSKTSPVQLQKLTGWLNANYIPMPKKNMNGEDNYTNPQEDVMLKMDNWQFAAANANRQKMLYFKDDVFGSTWNIDVSSDKITNARGKRIPKYAPGNIMGMSANNAAELALGWEPLDKAAELLNYAHRISSGFFMAEWLHLCAFSWGGLTKFEQEGKLLYRSSDIPGNLVLGTSDTNSVMTRFEKAWQTLILDSPDLNSPSSCPKLIVTRNSRKKVVIRDEKDATTGNYRRIESRMSKEEEGIAAAYDFLAYTISYTMRFPHGSELLNTKMPSTLNTTFYPFLRPVYHKLEDQLDKALYEEMKKRLLNGVQLPHSIFVPQTQSLHPHNQDGSTVFDSTRPHGGNFFGPRMDYNSSVRSGKTRYDSSDKTDVPSLKMVKKTEKKPTSDIVPE
ncbi:hypothetical protein NXS19_004833 [Fusarium pseudograminearum]|nr:hypothetical protein NXS19_004833 [Fusarium pseudograminearum]